MKKPVNKFALFLWIVAGITAFADLTQIWSLSAGLAHVSQQDGASFLFSSTAMRLLVVALAQIAMLAGLGAVIELLDHIRWDVKHSR